MQVMHVKLRNRCSSLNEHLYLLSVDMVMSNRRSTIFWDCLFYRDLRLSVSRDLRLSVSQSFNGITT